MPAAETQCSGTNQSGAPSGTPPDPAAALPGQHTPSRSLRHALGDCMVETVEWVEENRRSLVWTALLSITSGAALLLRLHGLPGYSRITSTAQLAAKLSKRQDASFALSDRHLCLPVLLTGAHVQGGHLRVQVLHYPPLLRWANWYRGRHPSTYLPTHSYTAADAPAHCTTTGSTQAVCPQPLNSSKGSDHTRRNAAAGSAHQLASRDCTVASSSSSSSGSSSTSNKLPPIEDAAGCLTCTIAGLQSVDASVVPLLEQQLAQSWCTSSHRSSGGSSGGSSAWPRVAQLRVIAATAAGAQAASGGKHTSPAVNADVCHDAATAGLNSSIGSINITSELPGTMPLPGRTSQQHKSQQHISQQQQEEEEADCQVQRAGEQQEVWAELWVRGLQRSALQAAAAQVAARPDQPAAATPTAAQASTGIADTNGYKGRPNSSSSDAVSSNGSRSTAAASGRMAVCQPPKASAEAAGIVGGGSTPVVQLHAAAVTAGGGHHVDLSSAWYPRRRRDVAEQLLRHGLAHLAEPEDAEWLGVRPARWRAYLRAAEYARRHKLGLHVKRKRRAGPWG